MKFDELNESTYILFAIKHYENPHCVTRDDFDEDMKRFKYLKRLLKRYVRGGQLRTHLIINHLIIFIMFLVKQQHLSCSLKWNESIGVF